MKKKDEAMREVYGIEAGVCGDCPHFVNFFAGNKKLFKCKGYGVTSSEATDWKKSAIACGLFTSSIDGLVPLIEQMKHKKKFDANKPVEGQIDMFGNN